MAVTTIISISLALRYKKGSFTYSYLKPSASDADLYELAGALSSLQNETFESANKIVTSRVTVE